jgi:hypothetical protein
MLDRRARARLVVGRMAWSDSSGLQVRNVYNTAFKVTQRLYLHDFAQKDSQESLRARP